VVGGGDGDDVGEPGGGDADLVGDFFGIEPPLEDGRGPGRDDFQADQLFVGRRVAGGVGVGRRRAAAEEVLGEARVAEQQRRRGRVLLFLQQRKPDRDRGGDDQAKDDQPRPSAQSRDHTLQIGLAIAGFFGSRG
jgi:hypothetical protein